MLSVSGISRDGSLKGISFQQQRLQKIAIAGETGSGKSTLLKTIAGLVRPDAGEVLFEGERVKSPEEQLIPGHPGIAYLSQHFELQKFLRVEQVLAYANELPDEEAEAIYNICRISHLLTRKTDQLSGGERQRIALARLLITSPRLLLLDEPFSNLDMLHKNTLKTVIADIAENLEISCILVSHDPKDSLSWADELLVMRAGKILQKGSPEELYRKPMDEYVAGQLGKYNLVTSEQAKGFFKLPGIRLNGSAMLVRPEDLTIIAHENDAALGKVANVKFYGSYYEIDVLISGKIITARENKGCFHAGDNVSLAVDPDRVWFI